MCEGKGVGQYTFSNRDAGRVVLTTGFEAGSVIDVVNMSSLSTIQSKGAILACEDIVGNRALTIIQPDGESLTCPPGDELSTHASTTHTTRPPRMDNDVEEIPISDDITALPVSILTYATTTYSTPPLTTYHEEISISARYPILSIILPIMTALLFVLLAFVCVCMCRGRCQRRNGGSIELREVVISEPLRSISEDSSIVEYSRAKCE
ncbi:hypothetical protein MAR_018749 [Mya arenaria]|uniref:Uncharacterized protein n=1 Tax=Mya arenaria TaxID=6604 RepID=A0ABY7EJ26_MYAAR|nr:hypothetical protein MAR_018749 [Mya arenaria]